MGDKKEKGSSKGGNANDIKNKMPVKNSGIRTVMQGRSGWWIRYLTYVAIFLVAMIVMIKRDLGEVGWHRLLTLLMSPFVSGATLRRAALRHHSTWASSRIQISAATALQSGHDCPHTCAWTTARKPLSSQSSPASMRTRCSGAHTDRGITWACVRVPRGACWPG